MVCEFQFPEWLSRSTMALPVVHSAIRQLPLTARVQPAQATRCPRSLEQCSSRLPPLVTLRSIFRQSRLRDHLQPSDYCRAERRAAQSERNCPNQLSYGPRMSTITACLISPSSLTTIALVEYSPPTLRSLTL